jgi:prepilin-type N-terminal cleavage/methylation domain-containing protein
MLRFLDKIRLQAIVPHRGLAAGQYPGVTPGVTFPAPDPRPARGFTLFELVVVICLVAILFAVAANRLWHVQIAAEQAAMDVVLGNLRSALGIKVAELYARGDLAGLRALEGSNPMRLMAETPENYLGEVAGGPGQRGSWRFSPSDGVLIYRARNEAHFQGTGSGPEARFRVRLVYEDQNRNRRFDPGRDSINGVRLAALEPYRWTGE